jgi:hypothetical protein
MSQRAAVSNIGSDRYRCGPGGWRTIFSSRLFRRTGTIAGKNSPGCGQFPSNDGFSMDLPHGNLQNPENCETTAIAQIEDGTRAAKKRRPEFVDRPYITSNGAGSEHLAGGASLFLASPRKSNQKEGDPGPQVGAERADCPSLRTNLKGRSDIASCADGPKPAIVAGLPLKFALRSAALRGGRSTAKQEQYEGL